MYHYSQLAELVKERHDAFARLKTAEDLLEAIRGENEVLKKHVAAVTPGHSGNQGNPNIPCFIGKDICALQWWFVNPGADSPEISLVRTKSVGTDFLVRTDGRFSNPENLLIWKYRPGTNVSG